MKNFNEYHLTYPVSLRNFESKFFEDIHKKELPYGNVQAICELYKFYPESYIKTV